MGTFSTDIKPTSSLVKKNMDFDYYNNVEFIYQDINLNEVSDHSDFSDSEAISNLPPYLDFESTMNIDDMMTALDNDIIIPNDEQVLDDPLGNLGDICNTTKNTDSEEEFQPESCTSDEDSSTDDEDYEPQQQPQPRKRISKKPAKYQSTDEEYNTSESETEEQTENNKRREQNRKSPNISHWLLSLLDENSSAIGWTNNSGEFKILDQKKLAKMWGERKGNKRMTYNNVARTMRYHYKKSKGQELEVVNKKLVYKFSKKFLASRR